MGRPSRRDELPLNSQVSLQPFEEWDIDFVGPIQPPCKKTSACYIITVTEYLIRWAEAQPMKDCTGATTAKFLLEYVLTRFSCPKVLMSDRVEAFNKILENALTKICNKQQNDWDMRVPAVLWAYRTTCKKLTCQTPFRLVYGVEVVMPMEYIVPSLCIEAFTGMADHKALEERLTQLMELEEDRFLVGFHQQVQKEQEKAWHNRHIKLCTFKVNDLVLLYDSNFDKFLGKFQIHYLGPYVIKEITDGGVVQLAKLNGEPFPGRVC
eukprot:PITA_16861